MSIKINPFRNIEALNFLTKVNDKKVLVKSEIKSGFNAQISTANNLHLFAGDLRKAQLFGKLESLNRANNKINGAFAISSPKVILGGDDEEVIKETKRLIDNYKRKIEPKEIKGANPSAPGKPPGHAGPKHKVKPEVQAEIMNNPDRIFSGKRINKDGSERYVDIYYKNKSAVVTEQGNKGRVITAYGLIDKNPKNLNPKPFNLEKIANNPNYVEIKLEKLGSTNVVYPNKGRFEAKDFPPGPPKNNPPKVNGNEPPQIKPVVTTPTKPIVTIAEELPSIPKTTGTNQPPITPKTPIINEELPVRTSPIGKIAGNISRGLIIMQLVQIGVTALNFSKLEADAEKFGFYVDPFLDKYIITNPDKAAQNLGEGFELTFYTNPQDYHSQGDSVKFTVKDGKFTNPDGYQLIFNKEKGYTEAVILA
jgi:hypothetical protein